jgi:hypothetical protein
MRFLLYKLLQDNVSFCRSIVLTTFGLEGDVNLPNTRQTSKPVASKAAKILSNPKSNAAAKSVAASDLAQTKSGKK